MTKNSNINDDIHTLNKKIIEHNKKILDNFFHKVYKIQFNFFIETKTYTYLICRSPKLA